MTDDPCDDWTNHIERRWVPMRDKRTRAERRAGGEPELVRMTPEELELIKLRFNSEYPRMINGFSRFYNSDDAAAITTTSIAELREASGIDEMGKGKLIP